MRASVRHAIKVGQERGEIREDIDAGLVAVEVVALLDGLLAAWSLDPRTPAKAVLETYCNRLVDDLAARSPRQPGRET